MVEIQKEAAVHVIADHIDKPQVPVHMEWTMYIGTRLTQLQRQSKNLQKKEQEKCMRSAKHTQPKSQVKISNEDDRGLEIEERSCCGRPQRQSH